MSFLLTGDLCSPVDCRCLKARGRSPTVTVRVVACVCPQSDLGHLTVLAEDGFGKAFRADEFTLSGDLTPLAYKEFNIDTAAQAQSAAVSFRAALNQADRAELDLYAAWPRALGTHHR